MKRFPLPLLMMGLTASLALLLSSCRSVWQPSEDCGEDSCPNHTKVCKNPTMHALACDLDDLEERIDKYGSVVAKQPDIWGQARLTKYREEFEKEMAKDVPKFQESLQGSISRSDQAYFANALAISYAAAQKPPPPATKPKFSVDITSTQAAAPGGGGGAGASTDGQPNTAAFAGFDSITRTAGRGPLNVGFAGMSSGGISLEPTIVLDQKARYLDHLNQIRRNNEGDDTADSPGYSLNLVRVPVSVLPGKCTDKGFGAEISITLKPYISDELLPTTFRQLVQNDLIDLLSLPITKVYDGGDPEELPKLFAELDRANEQKNSALAQRNEQLNNAMSLFDTIQQLAPDNKLTDLQPHIVLDKLMEDAAWDQWGKNVPKDKQAQLGGLRKRYDATKALVKRADEDYRLATDNQTSKLDAIRDRLNNKLRLVSSSSAQRVALLPLPPSQLLNVFGGRDLAQIVKDIFFATKGHLANQQQAYILEVRAALKEEVYAAYEMLAAGERTDLWCVCTPDLARAIRSKDYVCVEAARDQFETNAGRLDPHARDTTISLAWAIIVESALLNERLTQDIKEVTAAKGCVCQTTQALPFYLPSPPPEARQAFNDYVRCRWPIHVFTLDPMTQDQNLADAYSRRQEMQLALSLAFVSGNITARNMTRFARRIEEDMETIDLNRTQVGFSHGEDTFGWRFYPRFQTPEFESNATSLFRDQLIGGPSKNAEIGQMRLEPGMRECVAIVMMPSFVPYVNCETSSNWFKLTSPKQKEFTLTEAVRLGRVVKSVQTCSPNITNAGCYRDGDLKRLLSKAEQLEKRLPLQDMIVQVPYENTLGGFEMFNTGITDLAPQLRGWYGGPGVLTKADTQLFLVGDHFSVHQTVVTAGGKPVEFELLSRQIMKVTIPKGTTANEREEDPMPATDAKPGKVELPPCPACQPSWAGGGLCDPKPATKKTFKYVDVHVATAYGVTAHLEIPQVEGGDATGPVEKNTGLSWSPAAIEVPFQYAGGSITVAGPAVPRPPVTIKWDTKKLAPLAGAVSYDLKMAFAKPYGDAKVTYPGPFDETAAVVVTGIPAGNLIAPITVSTAPAAAATAKILQIPNDVLVQAVLGKFAGYFGPKNINPPVPVRLNKAVVVARDALGTILSQTEVGNELTITWQDASPCEPCLKPACRSPLPPPLPCVPGLPVLPPMTELRPEPSSPNPAGSEPLPPPRKLPTPTDPLTPMEQTPKP